MNYGKINKEVTISSVYFKNKNELETFPKQMELDGKTYTFLNDGWRYIVHKGKEVMKIITVSDGAYHYRLKVDAAEKHWILLEIKLA